MDAKTTEITHKKLPCVSVLPEKQSVIFVCHMLFSIKTLICGDIRVKLSMRDWKHFLLEKNKNPAIITFVSIK